MTNFGGVLAIMLTVLNTQLPAEAANVLVTDVSKDQISIRSNFAGEQLLLFGAIDTAPYGAVDGIVVVLRGPGENVTLRKKQKRFGIWINGVSYQFGPLPSFYAVASSAPLAQLAPPTELRQWGIGAEIVTAQNAPIASEAAQQQEALAAYRRLKRADDLFASRPDAVEIIDEKLFRAEINLPAGMPVGRYVTEFFAFKDGRLVGYQTGELPVDIVGAGHILSEAAYDTPLLYGLSGVAMALFMGWAVAVVFRRR